MAQLKGRGRFRPEEEEEKEIPNGIINASIDEEVSIGTIYLSGKIDQSNVDEITAKAMEYISNAEVRGIIFDMTEVTYISRAGLTMFSKMNLAAGEYEKSYQLTNLRADIAKVFQMMGYAAAFSITEKEEEI